MYQVEARLKRDFLRKSRAATLSRPPALGPPQATSPPQALCLPPAPAPLPVRQHALNTAALLLASFLVSDATAAWGRPYACV
jgi:hypothetical protein